MELSSCTRRVKMVDVVQTIDFKTVSVCRAVKCLRSSRPITFTAAQEFWRVRYIKWQRSSGSVKVASKTLSKKAEDAQLVDRPCSSSTRKDEGETAPAE